MALRGDLSEVDVPGVLELARQMAGHTLVQIDGEEGMLRLYLTDGEVVHAESGDQVGAPIVAAALARLSGTFELKKGGPPPPRITITLPWNTLLLQALQQLDESRPPPSLPDPFQEVNTMAVKEKLEDILKEMADDMEPGLRGIGVAGTDGLGIAFHKVSGEMAENLGAQMALIMQLSRRSTQRMENSDVEDVLVTTDRSYLLGRFVGQGSYFIVVNVERDSVLGNVRLTMRTYAERLFKSIPGAK